MTNVRPTAGGVHEDGAGGYKGRPHRDHKPRGYTRRPWYSMGSETRQRLVREENDEWRGLGEEIASIFGIKIVGRNRVRPPRERP